MQITIEVSEQCYFNYFYFV